MISSLVAGSLAAGAVHRTRALGVYPVALKATSPAELARVAVGFGQLAFRRDDLAEAIEQLERALELDSEL